ncbi:TIGR02588 family protein [Agrobacterium cavarae]|uniref:TIGR02588 family protein n=1 Tax=Agrobacterium cavarae TaxID=2528239 RepID=UPI002FD92083
MTKSSAYGHMETSSPHWIEWATGIISSLLVIALLGWISWDIYRYDDAKADFELSVVSVEPASNGFRVNFDIHNVSQTTAATVHVVGTLRSTDETTDTADVTFDYVAAESHDNGTLFFKNDPQSGTLDLRVGGFTDP